MLFVYLINKQLSFLPSLKNPPDIYRIPCCVVCGIKRWQKDLPSVYSTIIDDEDATNRKGSFALLRKELV